jgi:hypothetical protein
MGRKLDLNKASVYSWGLTSRAIYLRFVETTAKILGMSFHQADFHSCLSFDDKFGLLDTYNG